MLPFRTYSIPIVCVLMLILAWMLRPGQVTKPAEPPPPAVLVWCDSALQQPVKAIAEAFTRRHGVRVDLRVGTDVEAMAEAVDPGVATVVVMARNAARLIGKTDQTHEATQQFLRFLEGPLAASLFERYGVEYKGTDT